MPETGDELIDKWERELAMGLTPDLEEGYTQAQRKGLKEERGKSVKNRIAAKTLDGVAESYSGKAAILGRDSEVPSNLADFAKSGGLENMDPASVKRIISKLTPEQAQEIMKIVGKR